VEQWDVVDQPVRLDTGATWRLALTRRASLREPPVAGLGTTVFVTGFAISVLLAVVIHLGQVSRVRARALAHTNRELQSRVREAVAAHDRFRALNAELEARIAARTRALEEVVSDLETYNYSISHDLRTPLGAITNFAEILDEDYRATLDDKGRDIVSRMGRCAGMAVSMMDGLLAFSRVGRQELVPSRVDMAAQVRSAFADVTAGRPDPPPRLDVGDLQDVSADASLMRVVWTNLLSNAVKYSQPGRDARIEVSAQRTEAEDVFVVRDHGIGFDMREADRLFKVFERLHAADRGAVPAGTGGHGVGLAIVRRIVTRHGGRVWAQSAPEKGATFYFSIPRKS
jgi:signal transduction histidine kinase